MTIGQADSGIVSFQDDISLDAFCQMVMSISIRQAMQAWQQQEAVTC